MRRLPTIVVLLAVAIAAGFYLFIGWSGAPAEGSYRTAKADRGEIVATVSATGTINPTTTVIVGSQLSGQVVEVLADYNSEVKADQVVARLNQNQIRARLDAARADLAQMRAQKLVTEGQIEKVRAETEKAKAAQVDMEAQVARNDALLADAERALVRQTELRAKGFAAESTHETAKATRDAQQAALNSARAQVNSAKAALLSLAADLQIAQANLEAVAAQILQRQAAARQIEVDLQNSEIRSPVSGVVVLRNVELGQTVAASLQAPELFRIADDLRKMEISANIDETDVGRIKPGQKVAFTVNAFPGRTFEGVVKQVRLGSQTVSNVVIYTTIISIDNPQRELLPGMTANLRVETERRENVIRIPNAALRWRPPVAADQPLIVANEQPASPEGAPQRRAQGAGPNGGAAGGNNGSEFLNTIKTELKLSPEQTRDVDAAAAEMRQNMMANAGAGGDANARRERFRTARHELEQRIAGILTPEQKPVFEEIVKRTSETRDTRATQSGRIFIVGKDGQPQGVTVRIGATDGGTTEVVSGLNAGAEVIIGGGSRNAAAQRSGPRLGF
jgi:HlyD family secretion protein